ncbi:MAG: nitroreductase family protein [Bacillota bacterium]
MDVFEVVRRRRSIRRFREQPVEEKTIQRILEAAIVAPSGKNRQPWEFFVFRGPAKDELIDVIEGQVDELQAAGVDIGSSRGSIRAMREAPVLILTFNRQWRRQDQLVGFNRRMYEVDVQSIGAAIEHMLLAACAEGLSSLWICDVLYAEPAIARHLGCETELAAAVALGYPDEDPPPRPRRPLEESVRWFG